ncbi:MAG: sarcosine oxidase subunit delta [Gemmobacter sp.]
MRIPCPHCGQRDRREFYYYGAEDWLDRPAPDADPATWDSYIHLRDNPAGPHRDLWYHEPCGTWVAVRRNTVTHAVEGSEAVAGTGGGA